MLGKFVCKPTNDMLEHVDDSIKDLCYRGNTNTIKGAQFFMLEFYEKTLSSVIKNENLLPEKIIFYAVQISRALLHLHESKIAHLDMKLDNIMISGTTVIIIDFGCASILDNSFKVTLKTHGPGNIEHLAPEVLEAIQQQKELPCSGQYSWELGILLFEMLSKGQKPFDENSSASNAILEERLESANIPRKFHSLLKSMLCPVETRIHIADAWKTLEDFLVDISDF